MNEISLEKFIVILKQQKFLLPNLVKARFKLFRGARVLSYYIGPLLILEKTQNTLNGSVTFKADNSISLIT